MYNFDNTLVSYQDPRCIERRDQYSTRNNYFVSKQSPTQLGSTYQSTFYKTAGLSQGVKAPQMQPRPVTVATYAQNPYSTIVSMPEKRTFTHESPITKVTTQKQVFYPALHTETSQHLEFNEENKQTITYAREDAYERDRGTRDRYSSPQRRRYAESDYYSPEGYRRRREHLSHSPRRHSDRKRLDKYHTTTFVPTNTYIMQPGPFAPTQTVVPMYTHVPTTTPNVLTTYHAYETPFGQSNPYDYKKGSGK